MHSVREFLAAGLARVSLAAITAAGWSGEGFQAGADVAVAVHGHEVNAIEGAAVAEPGDLLAGGLDTGHTE